MRLLVAVLHRSQPIHLPLIRNAHRLQRDVLSLMVGSGWRDGGPRGRRSRGELLAATMRQAVLDPIRLKQMAMRVLGMTTGAARVGINDLWCAHGVASGSGRDDARSAASRHASYMKLRIAPVMGVRSTASA